MPPVFLGGPDIGVFKIGEVIGHNIDGTYTGWIYHVTCNKCGAKYKKRQCALHQAKKEKPTRCKSCPTQQQTEMWKRDKVEALPPELDFAKIKLRSSQHE